MEKMIKVADYIMSFLSEKGIKFAFEVPGGGAMFLNDAITRSSISPVFFHHEQACAMAAVGYSKLNNEVALVVPTSGCGSTNTITGILDAWQDSNPVIIVSGQANKKDTTYMSKVPLRKLGVQEVNIVEIMKPITKYITMVDDPKDIVYKLEKAYHLCTTGRPGPVWLDVPMDVQSADISPDSLKRFIIDKDQQDIVNESDFEKYLKKSKRPIIIAGNGIHLANAREEFREFIEHYNIPCTFTFLGTDLIPSDHPLYIGRIGIKGTRAGNFAVANSDLVISIGSSLSIPSIGFKYELFAREAKKIVVDIDKNEHLKDTIKIDSIIEMDAKQFMIKNMSTEYKTLDRWRKRCARWKFKWPVFDRPDIDKLNMYSFSKKLSEITKDVEASVVVDAGSAYYVMAQTMTDNRLILPSTQGEMGFTIPASIGVYLADQSMEVLAITGEGSFQFNIQELQTIVHNKMPIKIFILNNGGYLSIKNTQIKYFNNRFSGVDPGSGISFPECEKIATAYGLKFYKISNMQELNQLLPEIINYKGYCLCEIVCPPDEKIYPTAASKQEQDGRLVSQPLENMAPFLSEKELNEEMIIPLNEVLK